MEQGINSSSDRKIVMITLIFLEFFALNVTDLKAEKDLK